MPVKVSRSLYAIDILEKEGVFVMTDSRAQCQDIRPLRVAILNLMPNKTATETQLLRLIANSPLQTEVVFLRTGSYQSKNADSEYLDSLYKTIDEIIAQKTKFDGLIVTGAPVEKLDFSSVAYWEELCRIFDWAKHNVYSSLYICWAAQAALRYHYGIGKNEMNQKISGVFSHRVLDKNNPLVRGFDETFSAPQSRHTETDAQSVRSNPELTVLAESDEAGLYLAASNDGRRVFVFGHGEYDRETLHNEYIRDLEKGLNPEPPKHYYKNDRCDRDRILGVSWRAHAALLYTNWLNYCVYQATPYNIEEIE